MSFLYKSKRIGRNGQPFFLYKFRTLKLGTDKSSIFTQPDQYVWGGKFLRKTKLDELPQFLNVLKGEISIFGYRPEEERTWEILPKDFRDILQKHKPGIIDLSSLYFFNEEELLQLSPDLYKTYWEEIKPLKITLQMFYLENRCWLLNLAIVWIYFKKVLWSIIKK